MLMKAEELNTFFKPAVTERRRDLMSPVLGTEALYKVAGWMTPMPSDVGVDDDDDFDDDEDEEDDVREALNTSLERARSIDGCSVATEAHSSDLERSRAVAPQLRGAAEQRKSAIPTVLNLVANNKTPSLSNEKSDTKSEAASEVQDDADIEFVIPRSIREIYMISNRNRRNKKASSPSSQDKSLVDDEELAKAEELLLSRGEAVAGYFDSLADPISKRARTKSGSGRESAESVPDSGKDTTASAMPSKEDDMAFMKEIGWLEQGEDMASLLGKDQKEPVANPFFAGAALQGGALHGSKPAADKKNADKPNKSKQNRKERPERRDGKTFAYRKR
jgi:hypothetical protein